MSRNAWAVIIGIGVDILFGFLWVVVEEMPYWITILGLVVGGVFIVAGIIGLIFPKKKKKRIRFGHIVLYAIGHPLLKL